MGNCCGKKTHESEEYNSNQSIQSSQDITYVQNTYVLSNCTIQNTPKFYPEIKDAYVIKVYDGDTITIAAPVLNAHMKIYKFSVRILGIDCPEIKSKCKDEKYVAVKAKEFAEKTLLHKSIRLNNITYDKYGRLLADIFIDEILYKDMLLQNHLAYEYFGKTKNPPPNWVKYYQGK